MNDTMAVCTEALQVREAGTRIRSHIRYSYFVVMHFDACIPEWPKSF